MQNENEVLQGITATAEAAFSAAGFTNEPIDSFEHIEIEESDLTDDAIRAACAERVFKIANEFEAIAFEIGTEGRDGLTRLLANLNQAEMHISDRYGC